MENKRISVLLIEDSIDDAELIKRKLEKSISTRFQVTIARKLEDGLKQAEINEPDLIVSDLGLPDSHGLDTVTKILLAVPHVPLVVLSGFDDEETGIKAVQSGAQDYLVKGRLDDAQLERPIYYSIERARLQHELEQNSQEISKLQVNLFKILENSTDATVVVGENGSILFTNPAVESLFGQKQKELLNQSFQYPLVGGKTSEIEIYRTDGKKNIAEMNVVNISWEGRPACLVSMHNITKRKAMEEALRTSEEKYRNIVELSHEGIIITNLQGVITSCNMTFLSMIGLPQEEVAGKHFQDIPNINIKDLPTYIKMFASLLQGKKNPPLEISWKIDNGPAGIFELKSNLMKSNGDIFGVQTIVTDITERKRAEKALQESEEKFSKAFLNSPESIVISDIDDEVIIEANDTFLRFSGYTREEIIGKKASELNTWANPEERAEVIKILKQEGVVRNRECHFRMKSGEKSIQLFSAEIINIGDRPCMLSVTTDITERKKMEEDLKQSEEKYRELINTSIDAIISADPKMRVTIWNHGAEKIFGYTEKEMMGQSVLKIVSETYGKGMVEGFGHLHKTGSSAVSEKITETIAIRKNGTQVPIELSISTRKAGDTYIATAIIRDITARKEAEEKLRKIDQMKTEFLSNVSHELRTPLQSISGFTKLIMTGKVPDSATQQEFLQIIDTEISHLGNLINSLLDMSRLESGRFQIYKKNVSMRDIIIDCMKTLHGLAREKNITLSENLPKQLPEMEADNERVRQVILNLVGNAIKFSDHGGSVNIKVTEQNSELLFQVIDNGTGIKKEAMPHLFERFYRAEGETVKGGTGLGLYISKQIIDAHRGQIWAESKYGEGSTFSFTLPFNNKGGEKHGKENSNNRRRSGNAKTGRLLAKAGGVPDNHGL